MAVPLTIVAMGVCVFLGIIAPAVAERIRSGTKRKEADGSN